MSSDHTERLVDHWWPRPGWRPGRAGCTWYVTYEDAPALHAAVEEQHRRLRPLGGLDPIPVPWLHSTVQGVGWADEIPDEQLSAGAAAVAEAVAELPAFETTFGRPLVRGEAVLMRPEDADPWQRLWRTVRSALPGPFPETDVFRPHVSTAYANTDTDAGAHAAALDGQATGPVAVRVGRIALVRSERLLEPERQYRWTTVATAVLGG